MSTYTTVWISFSNRIFMTKRKKKLNKLLDKSEKLYIRNGTNKLILTYEII